MQNVRPHRAYAYAFGEDPTLPDFAYLFEFDLPSGAGPDVYTRPTVNAVRDWQRRGTLRRPRCEVVRWRGRRLVLDTRGRNAVGLGWPRLLSLSPDEWELLERLDRPTLPTTLQDEYSGRLASLDRVLGDLERRRLVIHRDGRWMR